MADEFATREAIAEFLAAIERVKREFDLTERDLCNRLNQRKARLAGVAVTIGPDTLQSLRKDGKIRTTRLVHFEDLLNREFPQPKAITRKTFKSLSAFICNRFRRGLSTSIDFFIFAGVLVITASAVNFAFPYIAQESDRSLGNLMTFQGFVLAIVASFIIYLFSRRTK